MDPTSVEKIAEIDSHVGAAMSGLVADARTLVEHARVEAQNHTFTYDEPMGVEALTQGTVFKVQANSLRSSSNRFVFSSFLNLPT